MGQSATLNESDRLEAAASVERLRAVWAALESLTDPEIPVLSLREMGILREVREASGGSATAHRRKVIEVVITPTYSGCPAMGQIEDDVRRRLAELDIPVRLVLQMAPAWTTDWLSETARTKLRNYGIAPPNGHAPVALAPRSPELDGTPADGDDGGWRCKPVVMARKAARTLAEDSVPCPRCGSSDTTETSPFGSTACKALFRCLACMEPFDHFKPH